MWIVRLALRRPYTFVVAALLVAILGIVVITQMPTDIFPEIDIPVIAVAFNYQGMSPQEMEHRIVTPFERILGTTVNGIEHIESQSLNGIGITKVYFQKNAKIEQANAQITAISQTAVRFMPPGSQPPLVLVYNAADVPILQLSLSSDTLPEQRMFDLAFQVLRTQLITIPGVQIPYPYGGKVRNVMVDLDPQRLYAHGVSPADVSTAINNQTLILPAGSSKIGTQEYQVRLNSAPDNIEALNNLPIKSVGNTTTYIKDVANVRDGFSVQTNIVHTNGKAGVLISILKSGGASTLEVVDAIKARMPALYAALPPDAKDLKITPLFDQSIFVRASVQGVIKEAAIAAGLTALMILLFLGSWRSTLIVVVSIPLSIMVSILVLYALGNTLNVMTLGGMALAVGILVDDATVEIENIHRNLHQKKRLVQAILDGAQQIAVPAFVATICICIVFVPVVFISGAAKFLFTPLALAVVFAMLTSYLLSRTLVPTMVHYLLAAEVEMYGGEIDKDDPHAQHMLEKREHPHPSIWSRAWFKITLITIVATLVGVTAAIALTPIGGKFPVLAAIHANGLTILWWVALAVLIIGFVAFIARYNLIWRTHNAFNSQFEKARRIYGGFLAWALQHRAITVIAFSLMVVISCLLISLNIGKDFFPSVDTGQLRMHVRCPPGTRLEQSTEYYAAVEDEIRDLIPHDELSAVLDNIGIPNSSINLSLSDGSLISPADGEILVSLNEGHKPSERYMQTLRTNLSQKFPELQFYFAPADIVTQVLNFGLQAPIDIQIAGPERNNPKDEQIARAIQAEVLSQPGVADVRLQQVPETPDLTVNVDRSLASQIGVTQRDVAQAMLISLSSSNQTAPNFWLDPKTGVNYPIFVQTPQYRMSTLNELQNTPVVPPNRAVTVDNTQLLSNLSQTVRSQSPTNITHYDIAPTYDVLLGTQNQNLGAAAAGVQKIVDKYRPQLPVGSKMTLRGQVQSMNDSFGGLAEGLIFAVVLVYLLMVINFQSWIDPLIILMALPGAAAGILWMLWATGTTISVPALMGTMMSIGVATANSILMITFANDQRKAGMNAHDAALTAGYTRLRPVIMTALAMIIGMLPMSLGLGEGGEQNAPLGRAVIGGLSMATLFTLIFVPVVYSLLRNKALETHVEPELR